MTGRPGGDVTSLTIGVYRVARSTGQRTVLKHPQLVELVDPPAMGPDIAYPACTCPAHTPAPALPADTQPKAPRALPRASTIGAIPAPGITRPLPHLYDLHADQLNGNACIWCATGLVELVEVGVLTSDHGNGRIERWTAWACPECAR